MARLPAPGQDDGTWGDILNEYLSVAHNDDGTLKGGSGGASAMADLSDVDVTSSPPVAGSALFYDDTAAKWTSTGDSVQATIAQKQDTSGSIGDANSFPTDIYMPHNTPIRWRTAVGGNDFPVLSITNTDRTTLQSLGEGLGLQLQNGSEFLSVSDGNLSGVTGMPYVSFNSSVLTNIGEPENQTDVATARYANFVAATTGSYIAASGMNQQNFYYDNGSASQGTTSTLNPDTIYLVPFSVGHNGFSLDRLGLVIQSGSEVPGGELYVGVYGCAQNSALPDGDPLSSAGPIDANASGYLYDFANVYLEPGKQYWLAVGTNSQAITVMSTDPWCVPNFGPVAPDTTNCYGALSQTWTAGSFPTWAFDTAQLTDMGGQCPAFRMRTALVA